MRFELEYGTLLKYSPREQSELYEQSRSVRGQIKAGRVAIIDYAIQTLERPEAQILAPFIEENAILVPIPKSTPIKDDQLWPSMVIAEALREKGYGREIIPCIERTVPLPRSASNYTAETRPQVDQHIATLNVIPTLIANPTVFTLIDDVLTLGRTSVACAEILSHAYPDATIRVFAMISAEREGHDFDSIFDPQRNTIILHDSGKTFRNQ